jgi:Flp pilus assembly protein protease CpaA
MKLLALSIPVVFLTAYAAYTDIRRREIDDWVSIIIAVYGFVVNLVLNQLMFFECLFYAFVVFVSLYLVYLITNGNIGGGDIKLLTALALYFADKIVLLLFLSSIIAFIYGIVKGIKEKTYLKTKTVFAPAIFAATFIVAYLL